MPSVNVHTDVEKPCRRCREHTSILVVRTEPLCRECFTKYVHTKIIKRMESFRVRFSDPNNQRRILLPLSFGVSSVTLLQVLNHHLKTQIGKTGRTGFILEVIHIESPNDPPAFQDVLATIQKQFPDHHYTSLPLHDVFRLVPNDSDLLTLLPGHNQNGTPTTSEQLGQLIDSLPSASSRADATTTLRTRLLVEYAKSFKCESILWGDSTTKLAEKTLSETAKGRGFSLPWQVTDGDSPFGIAFHFPLRDLLKKELFSYVRLCDPPLASLVHEPVAGTPQASMSSKNTTIDDLMRQYFESVEENFPSIVSNVVRTSGKLEASTWSASDRRCSLCSMPVSDGRFGIHGWGGDQQEDAESTQPGCSTTLCYGCTRSLPHHNIATDSA